MVKIFSIDDIKGMTLDDLAFEYHQKTTEEKSLMMDNVIQACKEVKTADGMKEI